MRTVETPFEGGHQTGTMLAFSGRGIVPFFPVHILSLTYRLGNVKSSYQ